MESFEIFWHKISQMGHICEPPPVIPKGLMKMWKIRTGGGAEGGHNYGIPKAWA